MLPQLLVARGIIGVAINAAIWGLIGAVVLIGLGVLTL